MSSIEFQKNLIYSLISRFDDPANLGSISARIIRRVKSKNYITICLFNQGFHLSCLASISNSLSHWFENPVIQDHLSEFFIEMKRSSTGISTLAMLMKKDHWFGVRNISNSISNSFRWTIGADSRSFQFTVREVHFIPYSMTSFLVDQGFPNSCFAADFKVL